MAFLRTKISNAHRFLSIPSNIALTMLVAVLFSLTLWHGIRLLNPGQDLISRSTIPDQEFDIVNYTIKATVTPSMHAMACETTIRLISLADNLKTLYFEFGADTIKSIDISGVSQKVAYLLTPYFLKITLPRAIQKNQPIILTLNYAISLANPRQHTFSRSSIISLSGTAVQHHAKWYPFIPGDIFTASLHITVPRPNEVVAPGKLVRKVHFKDTVQFSWRVDIPTNKLAFVVNTFSHVTISANDIQIRLYTLEKKDVASLLYPQLFIIYYYSTLLKVKPPAQLNMIELPSPYPIMHDNAGIIGIPSHYFSQDRHMLEEIVAHEVAHQWFNWSAGREKFNREKFNAVTEGLCLYLYTMHLMENKSEEDAQLFLSKLSHLHQFQKRYPRLVLDHSGDTRYAPQSIEMMYFFRLIHYLVGDIKFRQVIGLIYERSQQTPLSVSDIRSIVQEMRAARSNDPLDTLYPFQQIPSFTAHLSVTAKKDQFLVTGKISQKDIPLLVPLEILLTGLNGHYYRQVSLVDWSTPYQFALPTEPNHIQLDPNRWLLTDSKDWQLTPYESGIRRIVSQLTQAISTYEKKYVTPYVSTNPKYSQNVRRAIEILIATRPSKYTHEEIFVLYRDPKNQNVMIALPIKNSHFSVNDQLFVLFHRNLGSWEIQSITSSLFGRY